MRSSLRRPLAPVPVDLMPSLSRSARVIDVASRLGTRVAGVPEAGPFSVNSGRGGPLPQA
jgi:hypothetical protein